MKAWTSAAWTSNTATSSPRPQRRLGGAARAREIPAQHLHPARRERPHHQPRAQLGQRPQRGAPTRQTPLHHHRAQQGRLPLQPRRLPDHPHPDDRGQQGHRPLRQHEQPRLPGAGAHHRQLLPQQRAGQRRDRLPLHPERTPGLRPRSTSTPCSTNTTSTAWTPSSATSPRPSRS